MGVRASADAAACVFIRFVLDGFPYPPLVWLRRTPQQRRG